MPPPIDDPVLGRLEWWDGPYDILKGKVEYRAGHRVCLYLWNGAEADDQVECLANTRMSLARFQTRECEYRLWSANQLNETRRDAAPMLSREDVANLLEVAQLVFFPDGQLNVCWTGHDILFPGHNIVTEIAADGECGRLWVS